MKHSTRGHGSEMNRQQRRDMMRKIQSDDLSLEVVHRDAAGIDIGNESHYVAVPPTRDSQPVRRFGCTTAELKAMAHWLQQCDIRTVAMQSTGVYWIAVYEILEAAGLDVYLVNARDTKNLPGRKSDVQESQWLMKLHTYGLLRNSFRPPQEIRTMRTYWRQRNDLVQSASRHIHRMQKALTQMNLQLANVLADVSGMTGQAIIKAILAGERDPQKLAAFRDPRVKASKEEIARSLEGTWQEDLLFVLKQEQDGCEFCQKQMVECDRQLEQYFQRREDRTQGASLPEEKRKTRLKKKNGNKTAVRFAGRVVSHDRYRPDPDRRHRCHDRGHHRQRSGMGYEQMEERGPFRFLAPPVSRQPNQREQDYRERSAADEPPRQCRSEDGGQYVTPQQYLSRSTVSPIQSEAGRSGRGQGYGS
jgi:transposase